MGLNADGGIRLLKVTDIDTHLVKLPGDGLYEIDGQVVRVQTPWNRSNDYTHEVKDPYTIRRIRVGDVLTHYLNPDQEILTLEEFKAKELALKEAAYKVVVKEDEDGDNYEETLVKDRRAVHELKFFQEEWRAQYKPTTIIGDPLPVVDEQQITFNTGSRFVVPAFFGRSDLKFFEYRRIEALHQFLDDTFKEFGYTFTEKGPSDDAKTWAHDLCRGENLEWVKAFGDYPFRKAGVFTDKYSLRAQQGTLQALLEQEASDRALVQKVIRRAYNEKFGNVVYGAMELGVLKSKLTNIQSTLQSVKPFQKSYHDLHSAKAAISKLIQEINQRLELS